VLFVLLLHSQCMINGDVGFDLYDDGVDEHTMPLHSTSLKSSTNFIRRTTMISRNTQQSSIGNVTSLTLINTDTNLPILDLINNTIINIAEYNTTNFNIQAFVTMPIGYIQFGFNSNPKYKIELNGPYTLCGNIGTKFVPCSELTVGEHTISATPYLNGIAGFRRIVVFTIINTPAKSCTVPRVSGLQSERLNFYHMISFSNGVNFAIRLTFTTAIRHWLGRLPTIVSTPCKRNTWHNDWYRYYYNIRIYR
jgi:hypothetical protein